MAAGISAQDIRRVEFRERLRGYHQGDVDEFLERVAAAVEQLEREVQEATAQAGSRPADRAEAPSPAAVAGPVPAPRAAGAPGSEQSLRRTLELAQRAADLAVQEAREQGAAIVTSAEARAATLVADAEERARIVTDDAQREVRAEVARLEAARDQLRAELDVLARLVDNERERARAWLAEVAAALDRPVPGPAEAGPGATGTAAGPFSDDPLDDDPATAG
jgi:cell division initiation protein